MLPHTAITAPRSTPLLTQLGVAALYFALGHIIHQSFTVNSIVAVVWPGSGLALAALLIGGKRYLWGVLAGALALNAYTNSSFWAIGGVTLANVTEVLLGWWILTRYATTASSLRTLPDYLKLILLGGAVAGLGGAIIGSTSILLAGYIQPADWAENVSHWWMGDTLGVALIAPFILSLRQARFSLTTLQPWLEGVLLLVMTLLVGQVIFLDWFHEYLSDTPKGYWMFLFVTWIAVRMGIRGATTIILIIAVQGIVGAYQQTGFFAHDIERANLHNYWAYMLILSLVGLAMAIYVDNIKHALSDMQLKDSALNAAANGIMITDVTGSIQWANQAFSRVTGYTLSEVLGRNPKEIVKSGKHNAAFYRDLWTTILAKKIWRGEIINRNKQGELYDEELAITPILDRLGKITHFVAIKQDISARKAAEKALASSEERARLAIKGSHAALWDYDVTTGDVYLSEGWSEFLGYDQRPTTTTIHELTQLVPAEEQEQVKAAILEAIKGTGQSSYQVIHRVKKVDGEYIWIRSEGRVTERDQNGHALRMTGTNRNITERKLAEDALRESEEKLRGLYELSPLGIALTDMSGHYIEFNDAFQRICGYERDELNRLDYWALTPQKYEADEARQLESLQQRGHYGPYEKEYIRKDGSLIPIQLNGLLINGKDGNKYIWSIVEDISERKQMEQQIRELAFYDPLTRLPNRRLMDDRLVQAMSASKRSERYAALMVLDLDNFKPLNDTYGHGVGDLLLIEVANRLKGCVREMDTVARFGGDEFVVMLSELNEDREESAAQAHFIAEKIRSSLARPYLLHDPQDMDTTGTVEHHCSSSIGVVLFVKHDLERQEIFRRADEAMYRAKESGRNRIEFY